MAFVFDGPTKIISLTSGTTSFSVRDLWSRWVDWTLTSDNSKYAAAMTTLGGDVIDPSAGTIIPVYGFLQNGWKIKPQEADHTLTVTDGILLVSGGGDPFVNPDGDFVVRINYQQPVQAISFSSDGAGAAPSAADIASAVWNELASSHNSAGSTGKLLTDIKSVVDGMSTDIDNIVASEATLTSLVQTLLKYSKNRTRIDKVAKTLTIYDDDTLTPIKVFDLKDSTGNPSITEIIERLPQ